MNSLIALNELRANRHKKQQEKVQYGEIKKQFEKIQVLRREREALHARLGALSQGISLQSIDGQGESLTERKNIFAALQEKLCAYRLIGPCGLTVVDVDTNCLVVTFTSMWKNITESYILKIVASDGQVRVSGTNIPYFIDVQSMLEKSKSPAWHQLMDDIGRKINAYIQRKGELDYIMKEHKEFIKSSSPNESLTSIEVIIHHKDQSNGAEKEMCIYLVYPTIDSSLPDNVSITTEKMLTSSLALTTLRQKFLSSTLSTVMPAVIIVLLSSQALDISG